MRFLRWGVCPVVISCVLPAISVGLAPALAQRPAPAADDLPGPPLEVEAATGAIALPEPPAFELYSISPEVRSAPELRVYRDQWLDRDVRVRGYVTWVYDCADDLMRRNPQLSRAKAAQLAKRKPAACAAPRAAVGHLPTTPREASISIVDLPAAKAARAALVVGRYVELAGRWALRGKRGDTSSDGLLSVTSVTALELPLPSITAPPPPEPALAIPARPPAAKLDPAARSASLTSLAACTRAFSERRHAEALTACDQATARWPGNHMAWYVRSSANMALGSWPAARADVERAVALRPDVAMYQLYHGVALYEEALAKAQRPQLAADDPALPKAKDALRRAAQLAPSLWRAHMYLARVYSDLGRERDRAQELLLVIRHHPRYIFAYASLVDSYRRWSYLDEALEIAHLGISRVSAADAGVLWLGVAAIQEARGNAESARSAYDQVLAQTPAHPGALLSRARLLAARGDAAGARRDLDALAQVRPADASIQRAAAELADHLDKAGKGAAR